MSAFDETDVVVVGRVHAPYGVKGWVHLTSYTDPEDNLLEYQPCWRLQSGGQWQTVRCLAARGHGKGFVACFAGSDDRDAALALRGSLIGVPRDTLPELATDEYYWRDLIGMIVLDGSGRNIGVVAELMETGANDVLVVSSPGNPDQQLIPFSDQHVVEVDLEHRQLIVDWDAD